MARSADDQTFSQALVCILEAGQRLVVENLRLARLELGTEVGFWARHGVWFLGAVAMAASAWGLLCAGAAVVLASWMGLGPAVFALAAFNLAAGAVLLVAGMRKLSRRRAQPAPGIGQGAVAAPSLETELSGREALARTPSAREPPRAAGGE